MLILLKELLEKELNHLSITLMKSSITRTPSLLHGASNHYYLPQTQTSFLLLTSQMSLLSNITKMKLYQMHFYACKPSVGL